MQRFFFSFEVCREPETAQKSRKWEYGIAPREKCFQSLLFYYATKQDFILQSLQSTVFSHLNQISSNGSLRFFLRTAVKLQQLTGTFFWWKQYSAGNPVVFYLAGSHSSEDGLLLGHNTSVYIGVSPYGWGGTQQALPHSCLHKQQECACFPSWCSWYNGSRDLLEGQLLCFRTGKGVCRSKAPHSALSQARDPVSALAAMQARWMPGGGREGLQAFQQNIETLEMGQICWAGCCANTTECLGCS